MFEHINNARRLGYLLLCLLAVLLPGPAKAGLWIAGYYPGYESGTMAASNIDFSVVTHVIHFALVPETNGGIDSSANSLTAKACTNLVALAHAAGRKALICVGGGGGGGTETDFLAATTPANLGIFVTNLVNFMSTYGYDGVDLDWEPFSTNDVNQYTNLVNGLRTALNGFATHKLLTVAAPDPESDSSGPVEFAMFASVQGQFDQINIMTYDMSGPYGDWVTWFNSPIYDGGYTFPSVPTELVPSINNVVTNFIAYGVQPGKMGIGQPFYGYVWTGGPGVTHPRQSWPTNSVPTISEPTYASIMTTYYQSNLYHWDNVAQAAYLSITNNPASDDMFISYDDVHSCQAKVSYARNMHLGGLIIWELSQDYFSGQPAGQRTPLTTAFKQALATPSIGSIQLQGKTFSLDFSSMPLGLYCVQWSSNLSVLSWNTLTNNVSGTGTNVPITDPTPATAPARYYRIKTPP